MAQDDKGGSQNPVQDAGSQNPNPIAKMSIDEALARVGLLEKELADRDKVIADLTLNLKAANDVLEAQEKAKFITDIISRSNFTVEDLSPKSLEELQRIKVTLDQVKLPTYKNIRFTGPASDQPAPNLTVGDLSIVTEQKRKEGRP